MAVYRLRKKQRGPWCSYCENRAMHRGALFRKFACDEHLKDLEAADKEQTARDSYQSEAEFQLGI